MNSPAKKRQPLRWRRLGFWIGIPSVVVLVTGILLFPRVQAAREAARNSQCKNNLFQHSGWHPGAVVRIDQDGTVTASCCPLCYTSAAPIAYVDSNDDVLNVEELPDGDIEEGKREIERFQATSEYLRIRRGFGGGNEAQRDEQALYLWEHYRARTSSDTAEQSHAPEPPS